MTVSRSERLIYLLDVDERQRLRCEFRLTRLMNWKSFQPAPIKRVQDLMQSKYRDYLREEDRRLIMRLIYWESSHQPVAQPQGGEAYSLLREMVETGRAFLQNGTKTRLKWGEKRTAQPSWSQTPEGAWIPGFSLDGPGQITTAEPPCYFDPVINVAGPVETPFSPALAGSWLTGNAMKDEVARAFCLRLMNRFPSEKVPLPGALGDGDKQERITPEVRLRVFRKDADQLLQAGQVYSLNDLALAEVRFAYGTRQIEWNAEAETIAFEDHGRVRRCVRDRESEEAALATLKAFGFVPSTSPETNGFLNFDSGYWQLSSDGNMSWPQLLKKEFPRLRRNKQWKIVIDPTFTLTTAADKDWFQEVGRTRHDWFVFEAGVRFQGQRIPVVNLIRSLLREHSGLSQDQLVNLCRQSSYIVPLEDGNLLVLPGERLADLLKLLFQLRFGGGKGDTLPISAWSAAELAGEGSAVVEKNELVESLIRFRRDAANGMDLAPTVDPAELTGIPADLRPYQRKGVGWLDFLREYRFGGVLADDMGLGKTLQVLAHIHRQKEQGHLNGPCLIVAPTSVIDNWAREQERFTPDLTLLRYHGAGRKEGNGSRLTDFDLVLTSYELTRIDAPLLNQINWNLIVLDEAQRIKNPDSETARALCSFSAHHRLCLTGTPLENHVGELWSLFHFLMPGYLGNRKYFSETFRKPIEGSDRELARETAAFLSQRIHPFVLRRKKDQVALELPPRTEVTRLVELSPRQAEIYEATRIRLHNGLVNDLEAYGVAACQIQILDALVKLRQLCCDPRLHPDAPPDSSPEDSAKLSLLTGMLESLLDEGRKVLIFSQFVGMLNLIAEELKKREWKFLQLTGETQDRGSMVDQFQSGDIPIFLISLKAGGSGLNLTAADTVIQYDPWWNPAVEQQAADRAYRIGQDKPVFHYRLIAKGTVEEKILGLQKQKQDIIDSILDGVPSSQTILDQATVEALFQGMDIAAAEPANVGG